MSELIIGFLIFIVGIAWVKINKYMYFDFFSPFNLLFFFWIMPLLSSYLYLSKLQEGISFDALFIILLFTLIAIAISIIPFYFLSNNTKRDDFLNNRFSKSQWLVFHIICISFLFLTILTSYFAEFHSNGIPLLKYLAHDSKSALLHRFGKDSRLQLIAQGITIAGMACFYLSLKNKNKTIKLILLILSGIPPLLGILKTSKSDVFIPFLCYFTVFYYVTKDRKTKLPIGKMLFTFFCILAITTLLTNVRLVGVNAKPYNELIDFRYKAIIFPINEILAVVYGYSAVNYENFSRYIESSSNYYNIGTSMFRPFLSILMHGHIADDMLNGIDMHYISGTMTVGTILRDLYIEGGAVVCIIGALIYSSLINYIYIKFRLNRSLLWMFLYINFLFPWVWMFFQNAFSILSFYINAFYIILIFSIIELMNRMKKHGANDAKCNLLS